MLSHSRISQESDNFLRSRAMDSIPMWNRVSVMKMIPFLKYKAEGCTTYRATFTAAVHHHY